MLKELIDTLPQVVPNKVARSAEELMNLAFQLSLLPNFLRGGAIE